MTKNNLFRKIKALINLYADTMATQIMTEWMRVGYSPHLSGNAEIIRRVKALTEDAILCEIGGKGQKALKMEYGKGSQMDLYNPYFAEYVSWSGFNDERMRNGMAVTGRKKGNYRDVDGKMHSSSGKHQGQNLENIPGKPEFGAFPPMHIIRNVVCGEDGNGGMLPALLADITEEIALFDFFEKMPKEIRL